MSICFFKILPTIFLKTPLTKGLFHSIIKFMGHGIIIVNPYLVPEQSLYQAQRLKEEFNKLSVNVEVVSDAFLHSILDCDDIKTKLKGIDFAVYLDKDKYQSEILCRVGVKLFNSHQAIRLCDDKGSTYIALANNNIYMPKTIFAPVCYRDDLVVNPSWAEQIGNELGYPVIVKESFGSMGKGVYKADNQDQLFALMKQLKLKPHLYQEYLDTAKGVDIRVIVIGGKAVCAMQRKNQNDFRSNIEQGGKGYNIQLPSDFKQVAEKCAKVLGLDYCGVDILYGKDNKPCVCEVNSNAFFTGIESTTGYNVAKVYATHIINTLQNC